MRETVDAMTKSLEAVTLPLDADARTIAKEWPKVRRDLDDGHLSPLGLIRVKSWNPGQLPHNHQVVAYGYDLDGDRVTLHLYDPNHHDDDEIRMELSLSGQGRRGDVTYTDQSWPKTFSFFRVRYRKAEPPPDAA